MVLGIEILHCFKVDQGVDGFLVVPGVLLGSVFLVLRPPLCYRYLSKDVRRHESKYDQEKHPIVQKCDRNCHKDQFHEHWQSLKHHKIQN